MPKIFLQIRALYRLLFLGAILGVFFLTSLFYYLAMSDRSKRRKKLIANASKYSTYILKVFNVSLICHNPIDPNEASLLVGNHIGFIDIVCLSALQPAVFITSLELRQTPGLGQICEMGGCAYVDRRNRMKIQDELADIVQVLKDGFRVVLYAESVASNGEQVLPFKKTLIMSSAYSGKPIRPFCFNFRKVNGGPVYFDHRDDLCWYGDHTFLASIWRSFHLNSITCEIEFLPLVHVKPEEDRAIVAHAVHDVVKSKYTPFKPGMNRF